MNTVELEEIKYLDACVQKWDNIAKDKIRATFYNYPCGICMIREMRDGNCESSCLLKEYDEEMGNRHVNYCTVEFEEITMHARSLVADLRKKTPAESSYIFETDVVVAEMYSNDNQFLYLAMQCRKKAKLVRDWHVANIKKKEALCLTTTI